MKKGLNKIPLPLSAVMLSFATLGNALKNVPAIRPLFGGISATLLVVLLLKIIFTFETFKKDMNNPIVASVFVTFFMGINVLATYVKPLFPFTAICLWITGLVLHIATALYVLIRFIFPTRKFLPSHYVTFVGIVVASVTAPAFQLQQVGFIIFCIGFTCFLVLTPFICKNLFKENYLPKPAAPTKVIVGAPLSLCLAGYLNSASVVSLTFAFILLLFSFMLTCIGVYFIATTIKKEFNPTYAAYTFPMVISAVAMKGMAAITAEHTFHPLLQMIAQVELIFAVCVVLAVFIRYILHFVHKPMAISA